MGLEMKEIKRDEIFHEFLSHDRSREDATVVLLHCTDNLKDGGLSSISAGLIVYFITSMIILYLYKRKKRNSSNETSIEMYFSKTEDKLFPIACTINYGKELKVRIALLE